MKKCCVCIETQENTVVCNQCANAIVCAECLAQMVSANQHHMCPLCRQANWTQPTIHIHIDVEESVDCPTFWQRLFQYICCFLGFCILVIVLG